MYLCLNRGTCGGNLSTEDFVKLSSDAGFDGADADLGAAVQKGQAWLADLHSSTNQKFGGWGLGDWRSDERKHHECLENLAKQAVIASKLKIDSCCTWIMPSADRSLADNFEFHVNRLKACAKVLAENGLRLGLEFVAPYHLRRQGKHEFLFTWGQMLELAHEVGPNAGLLVDCFHLHASAETMGAVSNISLDKIVHVHLNDCTEKRIVDVKDGERVLPGEGVIDTKAFVESLRSRGYEGPVSLEVFNAELRAMPALDAARKARTATRTACGI
jgi:sugar phosphate isomerase/epimerase